MVVHLAESRVDPSADLTAKHSVYSSVSLKDAMSAGVTADHSALTLAAELVVH
jgi:hypothetical protein